MQGMVTFSAVTFLMTLAMSIPVDAHDAPYKVTFSVSNIENGKDSTFAIQVHPEWAPIAAKHFGNLLDQGLFDGERFWKVSSGFMAQFGTRGKLPAELCNNDAMEVLKKVPNSRGKLAFVPDADGKSEILINVKDNNIMDSKGFVPFAEVIGGMAIIDRIYAGYGTGSRAPSYDKMREEGNSYLQKNFPKLSYIKTAQRTQAEPKPAASALQGFNPVSPTCLVSIGVLLCLVLPGFWMISLMQEKSVPAQVL